MKKISNIIYYILFSLQLSFFSYAERVTKKTEVITYPGGAIQSEAETYIKNNQKVYHGEYKEFYASGVLYKKINFKHGITHGKVSEYYPNSNKKWQGKYKNGIKTGCWTFFNEDGTKKMEGILNKKGEMTSLTKFYINGKKSKREYFENSKLIKVIQWDIAGNVEKTILTKN